MASSSATKFDPIVSPLMRQFDVFIQQVNQALQQISTLSDSLGQRERALGIEAGQIQHRKDGLNAQDRTVPHKVGKQAEQECVCGHGEPFVGRQRIGTKHGELITPMKLEAPALESIERTFRAQSQKICEQSQALDVERSKIATYERELGKHVLVFRVLSRTIEKLRARNNKARKRYENRLQKEEEWKQKILKLGTITTPPLDRLLPPDAWPNFETPLSRLSEMTKAYTRLDQEQSLSPKLAVPKYPTVGQLTPPSVEEEIILEDQGATSTAPPENHDDSDATADEEPESALIKFSPISKAILRQPGPETLAVIHSEPFSPIEESRYTSDAATSPRAKGRPAHIKSELGPESGSYSRFGYNRLVNDEEEALDLDNVLGTRQVPKDVDDCIAIPIGQAVTRQPGSGVFCPPLASPDKTAHAANWQTWIKGNNSPGRSSRASASRDPLHEILQPNFCQSSEGYGGPHNSPQSSSNKISSRAREGPGMPSCSYGKSLSNQLFMPTQGEKLLPVTTTPNIASEAKNNIEDYGPTERIENLVGLSDWKPQTGTPHKPILPIWKRRLENPSANTPLKKARTEAATNLCSDPFEVSEYRINPDRNDGVDFAFDEVVRDKSKKACLQTCVKSCCKDLADGKLHEMWSPPEVYKGPRFSADDSSQTDAQEVQLMQQNDDYREWRVAVKKTEQALQYGRHKAQHEKAEEVKFFWDSDFPTTQQLEEQRQESDKRRQEKGFKIHDDATKGGIYKRRSC
ncbi:hypothetical protein DRE_07483 [Drechslerella stenobrocha 248]|uniref:DNA endonuclease activator Ctp1 C-terminal domain-containing protein n=1 Tax=Drechslerella stenobrocha 248 TaxID=1043628 RepID=W7HI37_9PEZI|nr:hypothetical protein DRE_07483 [Drechslerella stenobrocha 248]